jgi:hypothetical protein
MKHSSQRILDAALSIQGMTGLAALAFLMYIGTFTRHWADDFCYVVVSESSSNIFEAIQVIYTSWSNRYANVLLVGAVNLFDRPAIRFFPALMIALMASCLYLAISQVAKFTGHRFSPLIGLNLAFLLTFFSILQAPNRFQSVYWLMGLVTYFAPLVMISGMSALIFWAIRSRPEKRTRWMALSLLAALAFLSGGLSETTLAFQVTFFGIALVFCFLFLRDEQKKYGLLFSGTALVVSLAALLVVFLSPGNAVRLEKIPESQFSFSTIPLIFRFAWDFVWNSARSFVIPTIISVLSAFGIAFGASLNNDRQTPQPVDLGFWGALILAPLVAYILIASLVAPSVYVYGQFGYPEPRALFPARFVLALALMAEGFLFGRLAARAFLARSAFQASSGMIAASAALIVVTSLYPIWFLQKEIQALPRVQGYAQQWDERNSFLLEQQQQGNLDIVLDGIQPPGGLIELRQDPNFWVNRCVADFYDLNSIAVFP